MNSSLKPAIGLLGGTFDPIHYGHLRSALELHQALGLSEVRFIPCYQPVHRKMPTASPEDRLNMVKIAVKPEPAFVVDSREIDRLGPSYTIDTLRSLREEIKDRPFGLIMGIDALLGFTSWHHWQDILELTHLIIAHRPQYQLPKTGIVAELLKDRLKQHAIDLRKELGGSIFLHPVTALEISSTDIRKQFAMDSNPRYLLPDDVYEYIKDNGTYSVSRL